MAKIFKILISIVIICFLPTKIFGFFAPLPDDHIHSMPFSVQDSNTDNTRPFIPVGADLNNAQTEQAQNSLPVTSFNIPSQNDLNSTSSSYSLILPVFLVWPLVILIFAAIFIFVKRKLKK